jgi:hypothetical protein
MDLCPAGRGRSDHSAGPDGNVAAFVTTQSTIGFSADAQKWSDNQRFQPSR